MQARHLHDFTVNSDLPSSIRPCILIQVTGFPVRTQTNSDCLGDSPTPSATPSDPQQLLYKPSQSLIPTKSRNPFPEPSLAFVNITLTLQPTILCQPTGDTTSQLRLYVAHSCHCAPPPCHTLATLSQPPSTLLPPSDPTAGLR